MSAPARATARLSLFCAPASAEARRSTLRPAHRLPTPAVPRVFPAPAAAWIFSWPPARLMAVAERTRTAVAVAVVALKQQSGPTPGPLWAQTATIGVGEPAQNFAVAAAKSGQNRPAAPAALVGGGKKAPAGAEGAW